MTGRKLILMAAVLILLVAVALFQRLGGEKSTASAVSSDEVTLLVGVDLNALTSIDVVQGSNTVSLVKSDGQWIIESLYGYPADFNKLADSLLLMAGRIELGSPVRAGNVAEAEYGFDGSEKNVILEANGQIVASFAIGAQRKGADTAERSRQCFIRRGGDPSIYLVDYDFGTFSANAEAWMDKELVNVESSEIVSVKAGDVDLGYDGMSWTLSDLDPATEEFQASAANRLIKALQYFYCVSVADPGKSDEELGLASPAIYSATTREGFIYTVKLGAETDKGRYARLAVEYSEAQPPDAPEEGADASKQEAYEKALDAYNTSTEANVRKAEELTARCSNWTYVIETYLANNLTLARKDLVKSKAAPAIANGNTAPTVN